jgi:formate hydrogenlyase transcriptional activator
MERSAILFAGDVFSIDEVWVRRELQRSRTIPLLAASMADREREMIEAALMESNGRVAGPSGAAAKLGSPPRLGRGASIRADPGLATSD